MSGSGKVGGLNAYAAAFTPSGTGSPTYPPGRGGGGFNNPAPYRGGGGGDGGYPPSSGVGPGPGYAPGPSGGAGFSHHMHHGPAATSPPPSGGNYGYGPHAHHGGHPAGHGMPHHGGAPHPPGSGGHPGAYNTHGTSFGPRAPGPNTFAPHVNAWNSATNRLGPPGHTQGHHVQPPPQQTQQHTYPVFIVMGAPRSGKTTVAKELQKHFNNYLVIDPELMEDKTADRYEYLEQAISIPNRDIYGYIVSGYGAESEIDIFYLLNALDKPTMRVVYAAYLEMPYASIPNRTESGPASTAEMSSYSYGYESCSRYLSECKGFQLISVVIDKEDRSAAEIVAEMVPKIRENLSVPNRSLQLVPIPKYQAFDGWTLVVDYKRFREVVHRLDTALHTDAANGVFPLRTSGTVLDYNRYVRHYHSLQQYDVGLATNGMRVVIFKIQADVFALLEHCACVYRLDDAKLDPFDSHPPKGENDDIVFAVEAELCTVGVAEQGAREVNHVLLRDVLFFDGKTMDRVPRHKRKEIVATHFRESQTQYVLQHVAYQITGMNDLLAVKERIASIVTGIRFEHPYGYKVRAKTEDYDNRLLTWVNGDEPLATLRLWNSVETEERDKDGNLEPFYKFNLMVVEDSSGFEHVLVDEYLPVPTATKKKEVKEPPKAATVLLLSFAMAEKHQLNDGQLVECRFKRHPVPQPAKGPAARSAPKQDFYLVGSWEFVRRRRDLNFPAYESTVMDSIREKGWAQDHLAASCSEMPYRDPAKVTTIGAATAAQ
jgi:hypothetical protein